MTAQIALLFSILLVAEAMMAGALAMVLTGCLTTPALRAGASVDKAYQSIEWRAIFLIAGMLPVSIAMNRTGAAEYLGQLLVNLLAPWGSLALMAGLFAATALLTQVMPGQVTAIVLAPIATPLKGVLGISAAQKFEMSPYALATAVALGTWHSSRRWGTP